MKSHFSISAKLLALGPTLFKACTGILDAFMSLRSLSASNLRSLDMLNLRAATGNTVIRAPSCANPPEHVLGAS